MLTSIQLMLLTVVVALVSNFVLKRLRRSRLLPPGPKGQFLIGNVKGMPRGYEWLTYYAWSKEYDSDIVCTEVFGQPFVILNSARTTYDLFEARSANYSDRPTSTMANELLGFGWNMVMMKYGERWRRHRKLFHTSFNPKVASRFNPIQKVATRLLLSSLLKSPEKFTEHVRIHSGYIILKAVYGYEVLPERDPYISLADSFIRYLNDTIGKGGVWMVDIFPFLKHYPASLPGGNFQRIGAVGKKLSSGVASALFDDVKTAMSENNVTPCIVVDQLSEISSLDPDSDATSEAAKEEDIQMTAAATYLAGTDTLVSTLRAFLLAMILHPEVQKKAQEQIDSATGRTRLPDFNDRGDLPYIQCILLETLRWNPVTPLALYHMSMEDDMYDGYLIPGGSIVIGNAWAILHDEEAYPEPTRFNADRFVAEKGKPLPPDPTTWAFGFGRRHCPGKFMALDNLWIAIASILAGFDIVKDVDENGVENEPVVAMSPEMVSHPEPFRFRLVPRLKDLASIIEES